MQDHDEQDQDEQEPPRTTTPSPGAMVGVTIPTMADPVGEATMGDRHVRDRPEGGVPERGRLVRRAWSSSLVVAAGTLLAACATATSGSGGVVSAPSGVGDPDTGASQVPAGCLLLVTGLTAPQTAGVYTGAFLVLRVDDDGQVRGEGGDFHSEGYDVRGEVGPLGPELQMNAPSDPLQWQPMPLVWVPDRETFDGWERVGAEEMREYSGGGVPSAGSVCREGTSQ